ncbi:MAG: MarR family transcriptional regulator [Chryseobacterium sp.]|nr:MAG: MarR family transcriptional regulator [Chryseobacterium sp.]
MTTGISNEDILHLLTGRTPQNINRLLGQRLRMANVSLTKEQWSVMAVLWKHDGCTQQQLADTTSRDRPSTTRLLDNLQKEGYIERRPHETDRRTNLIFLTEKGRGIEGQVIEALNETINSITGGVSPEEIDALRNIFKKINDNIQELENQ